MDVDGCGKFQGNILPNSIVPTMRFGGTSVMVWCCFSWFGVDPLFRIDKTMNAALCLNILDNHALTTLWQYVRKDHYFYQQDNTPWYTTRVVAEWIEDKCLEKLDIPVQTEPWPESYWASLGSTRALCACQDRRKNKAKLVAALKADLRNILPNIYKTLA